LAVSIRSFFYHLVLAYLFTISHPVSPILGQNDDQGPIAQ
jgi:hypothetical protein